MYTFLLRRWFLRCISVWLRSWLLSGLFSYCLVDFCVYTFLLRGWLLRCISVWLRSWLRIVFFLNYLAFFLVCCFLLRSWFLRLVLISLEWLRGKFRTILCFCQKLTDSAVDSGRMKKYCWTIHGLTPFRNGWNRKLTLPSLWKYAEWRQHIRTHPWVRPVLPPFDIGIHRCLILSDLLF